MASLKSSPRSDVHPGCSASSDCFTMTSRVQWSLTAQLQTPSTSKAERNRAAFSPRPCLGSSATDGIYLRTRSDQSSSTSSDKFQGPAKLSAWLPLCRRRSGHSPFSRGPPVAHDSFQQGLSRLKTHHSEENTGHGTRCGFSTQHQHLRSWTRWCPWLCLSGIHHLWFPRSRHGDQQAHRKAATTMSSLTKRVWTSGKLTELTKIRVYRACALSTILYGNEVWTLQARRALAGTCGTHGRIPKDILYGKLAQGKRPTARPQLRCKDVCKRDLKAMDIDFTTWEAVVSD